MSAERLSRQFAESHGAADTLVHCAVQNLLAGPRNSADSAIADIMNRSSAATRQTSIDQHREQYKHNTGWVFASIRIIAQRIARQRIIIARHIKKRTNRAGINAPNRKTVPGCLKAYHQELDVLEDHPILDILAQPNEIMTRWMLLYVTIFHLEITGKCHWWIYDAPKNSKLAGRKVIWPIPSSWIAPIHQDGQLFKEWEIRIDGAGEKIIVPGDQIIYFYYPDPANLLGAISPLQSAARSILCDESIAEAQRRAFLNDIWPGLALIVGRHPEISAPGVPDERPILDKNQRARTIAAIKHAYQGVTNYGEPLILDGFIRDVKKVTNNPRDMDFMQSGTYTKERITQAYNMNPIVMGEVEGANRASAAAADGHVTENAINPKIALISEILTIYLPPVLVPEDSTNLVIYIEDAIAYDPEQERADREQMLKYGHLSVNENRTENTLPPVHGGDVAILLTQQFTPIQLIREDNPLPTDDGTALPPDQSAPAHATAPPAAPATTPKPAADHKPPAEPAKAPGAILTRQQQEELWLECHARHAAVFTDLASRYFDCRMADFCFQITQTKTPRLTVSQISERLTGMSWWPPLTSWYDLTDGAYKEAIAEGIARECYLAGKEIPRTLIRSLADTPPDTREKKRGQRLQLLAQGGTLVSMALTNLVTTTGVNIAALPDYIRIALGSQPLKALFTNFGAGEATYALNHGHYLARPHATSPGLDSTQWLTIRCDRHGVLNLQTRSGSALYHGCDSALSYPQEVIVNGVCTCHVCTVHPAPDSR